MYLLKHARARLCGLLSPSLSLSLSRAAFCIANHDALLHVGRMPPNYPYIEVQFPLGGLCYHAATRGAFFMNKSWVSEMLMAETFADDISVCRPDIVENMLVRRGKLRTAADGSNHLNIIPFNFYEEILLLIKCYYCHLLRERKIFVILLYVYNKILFFYFIVYNKIL